jgi:hypothetical protein
MGHDGEFIELDQHIGLRATTQVTLTPHIHPKLEDIRFIDSLTYILFNFNLTNRLNQSMWDFKSLLIDLNTNGQPIEENEPKNNWQGIWDTTKTWLINHYHTPLMIIYIHINPQTFQVNILDFVSLAPHLLIINKESDVIDSIAWDKHCFTSNFANTPLIKRVRNIMNHTLVSTLMIKWAS